MNMAMTKAMARPIPTQPPSLISLVGGMLVVVGIAVEPTDDIEAELNVVEERTAETPV
jgi:hypothetical protein